MKVEINGFGTKRGKFSLSNRALNEEVIFDEEYHNARDNDEVKDFGGLEQREQYPPLQIVELHERKCTGEYQAVNFENIWAFDEGELRNWIMGIQCEIYSLKMKCINFDKIFIVLVKIMKKVETSFSLTVINTN